MSQKKRNVQLILNFYVSAFSVCLLSSGSTLSGFPHRTDVRHIRVGDAPRRDAARRTKGRGERAAGGGWRVRGPKARSFPTPRRIRGVSSTTKSSDQFYLFNTAFVLGACI